LNLAQESFGTVGCDWSKSFPCICEAGGEFSWIQGSTTTKYHRHKEEKN
jgi:hypothetical protein